MHPQKGLLSDSFNLPWKLTSQHQLLWLCMMYLHMILAFYGLCDPLCSWTAQLLWFVKPKPRQLAGPSGFLTRQFCGSAEPEGSCQLNRHFPCSLACSYRGCFSNTAVQLTPKQTASALRGAVGEGCQGQRKQKHCPSWPLVYLLKHKTAPWKKRDGMRAQSRRLNGSRQQNQWWWPQSALGFAYCFQTQEKDL